MASSNFFTTPSPPPTKLSVTAILIGIKVLVSNMPSFYAKNISTAKLLTKKSATTPLKTILLPKTRTILTSFINTDLFPKPS
jgi:hypothetical protein